MKVKVFPLAHLFSSLYLRLDKYSLFVEGMILPIFYSFQRACEWVHAFTCVCVIDNEGAPTRYFTPVSVI